jgi:hypothetical protein
MVLKIKHVSNPKMRASSIWGHWYGNGKQLYTKKMLLRYFFKKEEIVSDMPIIFAVERENKR